MLLCATAALLGVGPSPFVLWLMVLLLWLLVLMPPSAMMMWLLCVPPMCAWRAALASCGRQRGVLVRPRAVVGL